MIKFKEKGGKKWLHFLQNYSLEHDLHTSKHLNLLRSNFFAFKRQTLATYKELLVELVLIESEVEQQ